MLDAASTLFFERGYEAATLGEIVARSGGSLTTLYELFGNKTGLLAALVSDRCESIADIVRNVAVTEPRPREALRTIACHLFTQLTDPSAIALLRIVIAESGRQPELGRLYYDAGPASGRSIMAAFLGAQQAKGVLSVDDADEAALRFFHMLIGDDMMRLLCGLPAPDRAEVERRIDCAVDAFLRLHAPNCHELAEGCFGMPDSASATRPSRRGSSRTIAD